MKQRLLVMNGQKLLQSEQGGEWATTKVEKAGTIKPGIYSLYLALMPDKLKSYEGVVIHADRDVLYQQVGKGVLKHDLKDFERMPALGSTLKVSANFAAPCQHLRLLSRGDGGVIERQQIADIVTVGAAWQFG